MKFFHQDLLYVALLNLNQYILFCIFGTKLFFIKASIPQVDPEQPPY